MGRCSMDTGLPFNPLREHLYVTDELYDVFSADDPSSFARCDDIAIYRRLAVRDPPCRKGC